MKAKRGCKPLASGLNRKKGRTIGAEREFCMKPSLNTCGLEVRAEVSALGGAALRSNQLLTGQLRKENPACQVTAACSLGKQPRATCLRQHRNLLTGLHSQNISKKYLESVLNFERTTRGLLNSPDSNLHLIPTASVGSLRSNFLLFSFFFQLALTSHKKRNYYSEREKLIMHVVLSNAGGKQTRKNRAE